MKYGMDYDATDGTRGFPGLYCGASGWRYYYPWDIAPLYGDRRVEDLLDPDGAKRFPRGLWYYNKDMIMLGGATAQNHMICRDQVLAITVAESNFITFCDWAFDGDTPKLLNVDAARRYDRLYSKERLSLSYNWVHEL